MALLSYRVTGIDQVVVYLTKIGQTAQDLTGFWRDVFAPKYFAAVQQGFATEGRSGSGGRFKSGYAWAKLAPAYRAWKAQHYPGKKILERTGALRESLRWYGSTLGPGGIFEPTPRSLIFGTTVPYAQYHMSGTAHMPARRFLELPDPELYTPMMLKWIVAQQGS